jgi:hypothetical protein
MRTDCIVKLSKLQISELNTLVQKETSGDVEGNLLLRTEPVQVGESLIQPSNCVRWLGFFLDTKLSYKKHI